MSNAVYPERIKGFTWNLMKTPEFNTTVNPAASGASVRVENYVNPIWHWQIVYDYLYDEYVSGNNTYPYGYSDFATLLGFFNARGGQYDDFLFNDPTDNTVTNQTIPLVTDGEGDWFSPLQRTMGGQFSEDITDLQGGPPTIVLGGVTGAPLTIPPSLNWSIMGPGLSFPGGSYRGLYVNWFPWQANFAYSLGTYLIDPAGHLQLVTTAGTSGTIEPTWNDSGGTTPDDDGSPPGALVWTDQGLITTVTASFTFYFRVRFESDKEDFEEFQQNLWTVGGSESKNGKGYIDLVTSRLPLNATPAAGAPPIIPPAVLNPPPGSGLLSIVLFPLFGEPNPGGDLIIESGLFAGEPYGTASGSPGGVSVGRGPFSTSLGDYTASATVGSFALPPNISPSQVAAVFAVTSGGKYDTPDNGSDNPFYGGWTGPASGSYEVTGAGGFSQGMPPGNIGPYQAGGGSYAYQIAPVTPALLAGVGAGGTGTCAPDDVEYGSFLFTASLSQSANGYLQSSFGGILVLVVWYAPA